uniref:Terpine synthase-like protein MTPSL5 n=1 Tax=Anthoceros punctatus TaxID=3234 RepID=A0A2P1ED35_ANTPU|nr:terpine synthase-like protein MTPSL5 [Anthoceros punctatus]
MDQYGLTASMRCVSTSSSSWRALAFQQQGAAISLVSRLPFRSTLKHKAQATSVSLSVSVRCQGGAATSAKPAPVARPVIKVDEGGGTVMNTNALTPVYMDFLQRLSFVNSRESSYPEQDTVTARLTAICGSYLPERYISLGATMGHIVYSYHPVDLQVKIGHFTALLLMVDDLAGSLTGAALERYLEDMCLFQMKFTNPEGYATRYPGRGDLHEVLEKYIHYLKTDLNPFFPTDLRLQTLMIKSVLDFMEGNLQEQHYEEHPIEYTADMPQLPRFLRYKSGMSEPYAHFCIMHTMSSGSASQDQHFFYNSLYPMVPDLVDVFDFGNDVMSFYKEIQNGEDSIGILNHGRIHNLSPLQSLRDSMETVIHSRTRLMALADRTGSEEMMERIVSLFQGYLIWHVRNKRYRLDEILS